MSRNALGAVLALAFAILVVGGIAAIGYNDRGPTQDDVNKDLLKAQIMEVKVLQDHENRLRALEAQGKR